MTSLRQVETHPLERLYNQTINNKTMQDFDSFMKERLIASTAFVEGNFEPLKKISAEKSPATIFGPNGTCIQGAEEVNKTNEKGSAMFLPDAKNKFEVMHKAADDHLAYWTGIQHSVLKIKGQDEEVPMDLRVTEIFRKENGEWKLIHRHADKLMEK